jgi:hypothetical protein
MTAAGLTTVQDVLASKEDFIAYQDALAAGELGFRVNVLARPEFSAGWWTQASGRGSATNGSGSPG